MTQRDTILQELNELESSLAKSSPLNVYTVSHQYFEGLAATIMGRIKALEFVDSLSRETPYKVPAGYFDGLEHRIMESVLESKQTPEEELESLSPLLSGLKKESFDKLRTSPYTVPQGYFDNIEIPANIATTEKAKIISITGRKWFRYAAAAVVTGVVAISSFLIFNNNKTTSPDDIVKQTIKTVGEDDINNLIELSNTEIPAIAMISTTPEVKDLVKNISDQDIQNFVDDTQVMESDLADDILLN